MCGQHKSFVWAEPGVTTQFFFEQLPRKYRLAKIVHAHITIVSLRVVETWEKSKVLEDRSGASPMSSVEYTLEDSISTSMFHSCPQTSLPSQTLLLSIASQMLLSKHTFLKRVKYW
jgi:hypothetical protein